MSARARGFTLLEMLIALGLIVALFGSMVFFLLDLLAMRTRTRRAVEQQFAATTLIDRIEADLMSCITADAQGGAGVHGDAHSITILSRNVPVQLAAAVRAGSAMVMADLTECVSSFDPSGGEVTIARRVVGDQSGSADDGPFALEGELGEVRFRYHDGRAWRDSFDSLAANRLPAAVEVAIWFHRPQPLALEDPATDETPTDVAMLERETFDPDSNFDEDAYAAISDMETSAKPPPDRLRVIIVPDGLAEEDEDNEAYFAQSPDADTAAERGDEP
jgi:prepilin-type N-terminal cleavage/methylation domain-containing protein